MSHSALIRGARFTGFAVLLLALFTVPCAAAPAPSEPVKLVVIVSVDGLSWSRLDGYRPWYEAGFKRLLGESQVETACNYQHLNTETGPGHASIGTGEAPSIHGIVANRWVEANTNGIGLRRLYCTDQPDTSRLPGPHVPLPFWGGPFKAEERKETCTPYDLAPTLADVLGIPLTVKTGKSLLPRR
jgi:predicted AlkP superfamily pyrophosphatase or phosphodiesterase